MNIFWLPLAAATLHIGEEFFWPGGFTNWYHAYQPELAPSASRTFLFWINAALLFGCFSVGVDAHTSVGPAFFLAMLALLGTNGLYHLRAVIRTRAYSPGVITGTLLYLPLMVYGYVQMIASGRASITTAVIAALIGGAYPFVSYANHLRRARAQAR